MGEKRENFDREMETLKIKRKNRNKEDSNRNEE